MALFLSTYVNKVDKKGRVSVPASFRATLSGQTFAGIVAFRSPNFPALEACGGDRMERLSRSLDDLPMFSREQDDLAALIFAGSFQLPFDGDGRIVLPEALASHAQITDRAAFIGRGPMFQIWNPDAYARFEDEARQRIQSSGATLRLSQAGRGGESS
jgi:transcriptional regulator MraZ